MSAFPFFCYQGLAAVFPLVDKLNYQNLANIPRIYRTPSTISKTPKAFMIFNTTQYARYLPNHPLNTHIPILSDFFRLQFRHAGARFFISLTLLHPFIDNSILAVAFFCVFATGMIWSTNTFFLDSLLLQYLHRYGPDVLEKNTWR